MSLSCFALLRSALRSLEKDIRAYVDGNSRARR